MADTMTYQVIVTREGDQWLADVPDVPGAHTFANSLDGLRRAVREVIVLMDDLPDDAQPDVTFTFDVEDETVQAAVEVARRRDELEAAEAELRKATLDTIRALKSRGHSVRDVAALVGVTPGRVSQVAPERAAS
jgi:predicted RNase H-like HicB family nuclease